jgi:hypothetical protein
VLLDEADALFDAANRLGVLVERQAIGRAESCVDAGEILTNGIENTAVLLEIAPPPCCRIGGSGA